MEIEVMGMSAKAMAEVKYIKFVWYGLGIEPSSNILGQYQTQILKFKSGYDFNDVCYVWVLNKEGYYTSFIGCSRYYLEPAFSSPVPTRQEIAMLQMLGYQIPKELLNE